MMCNGLFPGFPDDLVLVPILLSFLVSLVRLVVRAFDFLFLWLQLTEPRHHGLIRNRAQLVSIFL